MREIKFRAWNDGEMIEGVGITPLSDDHIPYKIEGEYDDTVYYPESILMQSTGLKDIANVDIYEHDIVAYDTEDGICIAEVEWVNDVDPNRDLSPILGPGYVLSNARHWRDYEEGEDVVELLIVGNIYQNPELMK